MSGLLWCFLGGSGELSPMVELLGVYGRAEIGSSAL